MITFMQIPTYHQMILLGKKSDDGDALLEKI